jgi:tRNA A37 methylthiotransferase MiaB
MTTINLVSYHAREEFPARFSLAAMRLGSVLSRNHSVTLSHFSPNKEAGKIAQALIASGEQVVGLPGYSWLIGKSVKVAHQMYRLGSTQQVVVGGPEVGNTPSNIWTGNEILVVGEGETALERICEGLDETGKIFGTRTDLGSYQVPLFSEEFARINAPGIQDETLTFWETSRGCAYDCAFCDHKKRKKVDYFDMDFVRFEIENFRSLGIEGMFIVDPSLGGNRQRGKLIAEALLEKLPNVELIFYQRGEYLDEDYIDLLAQLNIREMHIGIQTLNPNVSGVIRRNNTSKLFATLPRLHDQGVRWRGELIVGLPGDNFAGLQESYRAVIEGLKPATLYGYHLSVLDGTKLMGFLDDTSQDLWVKRDPVTKSATESMSYTPEELVAMLEFSGGITSLYRFMSTNNWLDDETRFRRFNILEGIVNAKLNESELIRNCFRQDQRKEEERIWKKHFGVM